MFLVKRIISIMCAKKTVEVSLNFMKLFGKSVDSFFRTLYMQSGPN